MSLYSKYRSYWVMTTISGAQGPSRATAFRDPAPNRLEECGISDSSTHVVLRFPGCLQGCFPVPEQRPAEPVEYRATFFSIMSSSRIISYRIEVQLRCQAPNLLPTAKTYGYLRQ